jgi:hypothetical protein
MHRRIDHAPDDIGIAVVIDADLRNDIRALTVADQAVSDSYFTRHHFS